AGAGPATRLPHIRGGERPQILQAGCRGDRQGQQRGTAAVAGRPPRRGPRPLQDVSPEIAARLADLNIQLAAQARDYCLFVRGNCLALAQSAGESFTSIGASGMMAENGIAYLVWREGCAWLAR